ncbi:MAG: TIGR01620 family protein, partial [Paracoccaceae bacterium]
MTDPLPPRPFMLEVEDEADPAAAAAVPEAGTEIAQGGPQGRAMFAAARVATARASGLWRFALWAFGALFSFWLSVSAYAFVATLLATNPVLGTVAAVLVALAVLAALALGFREWAAFARLARLDGFRLAAAEAVAKADVALARR